jgi:hypothetical protein
VELCLQIGWQLNEWYKDVETLVASPVYDVPHVMILYWLSLLLVHPILCHIYERLQSFVGVELSEMECS